MPLPFLIIVGVIVFSIISYSKKVQKQQQNAQTQRNLEELKRMQAKPAEGEASVKPYTVSEAERARRQEELQRRLEANRARREAELREGRTPARPGYPDPNRSLREGQASVQNRASQERRPLEKRDMTSSLQKEKPVRAHSDDACGGGSIHDGYHEGVTKFAGRQEASVAGSLGHRLADEDERMEKEATAAENAKRAMARIAKLPPLAQGMIYSEILGKPRSETA